jgi:hypothetical protein
MARAAKIDIAKLREDLAEVKGTVARLVKAVF